MICDINDKHSCILLDLVNSYGELDEILKSRIFTDESGHHHTCTECSYSSTNRRNVVNHIESKHVTTCGVECSVCKKTCPTREALRKHIARNHKIS